MSGHHNDFTRRCALGDPGHSLHNPGADVGPPLPAGPGDVFAQPVLVPHLRPKLLDLGGEQTRPLAVLDLAQPLVGLHSQLEHLGERVDRVTCPLQVARHDPRDGHLGEAVGDGEGLTASQIGERDIGLPYESSFLVPLGFPVPDEEQGDIVIHHSSDGTPGFCPLHRPRRGRIQARKGTDLSVVDTAAPDALTAARDSLNRHAWQEALDLFTTADEQTELSGLDLKRMAEAAWFTGQVDLMIESFERAFKVFVSDGERARAAKTSVDLARQYAYKGQGSIAGAWLRRGERLITGEPEGPAHGYLSLSKSGMARIEGNVEEAIGLAEEAVRIGTETGDADLEAMALVTLGTLRIAGGAVVDGFQLLEEASVAAVNGELSPLVTGITYCNMISACRDLTDYVRAGEWTQATEKWCEKQSISGFPGICRVHRAEVVAMSGAWDQAEAELERATAELEAYNATPPRADGFYALAVLRFRRGNLEAAEEALRQSHALGHSTQPLLSLIRLAQGNTRTAAAGIRSALQEKSWDRWTRTAHAPHPGRDRHRRR